ncbi:MAG: hypothetical protein AB7I50_11570 [Vicinamibacterales bacterium]
MRISGIRRPFGVEDFDASYERMIAAGVRFVSPPRGPVPRDAAR